MNSSSVAAIAPIFRSASRSSWPRRMLRGAGTTGLPSCQPRSAITSAVPGSHGSSRSVVKSGVITMSPYPASQLDIAYPSTVFMSTSTASR